jgi:hypothetical protein
LYCKHSSAEALIKKLGGNIKFMTGYLLDEGVEVNLQYQHNQTDSLLGTSTQGIPNLAVFWVYRLCYANVARNTETDLCSPF